MSTKQEEPKQPLPAGHPEAGYVGPDPSYRDGGGVLPADEQKAYDEVVQAHEDEVAAVAEHEDKIAKKERADESSAQEKETTSSSKSKS